MLPLLVKTQRRRNNSGRFLSGRNSKSGLLLMLPTNSTMFRRSWTHCQHKLKRLGVRRQTSMDKHIFMDIQMGIIYYAMDKEVLGRALLGPRLAHTLLCRELPTSRHSSRPMCLNLSIYRDPWALD